MPLFRGEEVFLNRLEALIQKNSTETLKDADEQLEKFITNRYGGGNQQIPFTYAHYKSQYKSLSSGEISGKDFYMKIIVDERRREFVQEGLRWFDMKRFALFPVSHEDINGNIYTLPIEKSALEIPEDAIINGLQPNYNKENVNGIK